MQANWRTSVLRTLRFEHSNGFHGALRHDDDYCEQTHGIEYPSQLEHAKKLVGSCIREHRQQFRNADNDREPQDARQDYVRGKNENSGNRAPESFADDAGQGHTCSYPTHMKKAIAECGVAL